MSSLDSNSDSDSDSNDFICPNNFRAYQPPPSASQEAIDFWRRFKELAARHRGLLRRNFEDHVKFEELDEPELDIGKDYFPIDANENKMTDPEEAWDYFEDQILNVADRMVRDESKEEDEGHDEWICEGGVHSKKKKNKGKKANKDTDVAKEVDEWIDRARANAKKKGKKGGNTTSKASGKCPNWGL